MNNYSEGIALEAEGRTFYVPLSFGLLQKILRTGTKIDAECISGIPSDASLIDVVVLPKTSTVRLVFESVHRSGELIPTFKGGFGAWTKE